jgi:hypothetical protein
VRSDESGEAPPRWNDAEVVMGCSWYAGKLGRMRQVLTNSTFVSGAGGLLKQCVIQSRLVSAAREGARERNLWIVQTEQLPKSMNPQTPSACQMNVSRANPAVK